MRFARTALARCSLLLGLLAWVVAAISADVHQIVVAHVACSEHGDIVELAPDRDAPSPIVAPTVTMSADDELHDHDHGCALAGVVLTAASWTWTVPVYRGPRLSLSERPVGADAPRGPPLAYAPKTSPPLA